MLYRNPYIIKEQAFRGGAYSCVNNVSTQAPPPKWNMPKHAQHQMSSPWWRNLQVRYWADFPRYITGRWLSYRKANSKTVRLYARQKFPGFERGSGYSSIYNKTASFGGRGLFMSRTFWGRSLCLCQHRLLPHFFYGTCPNMPITTRCRRLDDAIFDDNQHHHQMSIASPWWRNFHVRYWADLPRWNLLRAEDWATEKLIAKQSEFTLDQSSPDLNGAQVTRHST